MADDPMTPAPTVHAIAVPPQLLASMSGSMADAVTVMRSIDAKLDGLAKAQEAERVRIEPALQAHADHLRRLAEADAEVTVDARSAAKRAEIAAAEAKAQAEAQRIKEAAETRAMWVKIAIGIASLIVTALAGGAGATLALGGSP